MNIEHIEYFPYGEMWVQNKATSAQESTPYKFTGKELDEETGNYYHGARYYDPKLSRWISADDRFDDLYSTQGQDVYSYVQGNPVRYNDPTGHYSEDSKYQNYGFGLDNRVAKEQKNNESGKTSSGGDSVDRVKLRNESIKQTDKGMNPKGDTACRYRDFQRGVEDFVGKNMTLDEINASTQRLSAGDDPAIEADGTYSINRPVDVIKDALHTLGKDPSKYNIFILKPGNKGYDAAAGKATFSLRGVESRNPKKVGKVGHWQDADGAGNFRWDPKNGPSHDKNRKLIEMHYVFIIPKED